MLSGKSMIKFMEMLFYGFKASDCKLVLVEFLKQGSIIETLLNLTNVCQFSPEILNMKGWGEGDEGSF